MNPQTISLHRKKTVCRPVGTRFYDCYAQDTVKHPPSVIIWGAIFGNGTAFLFLFFLPIEITMNSLRYPKILKNNLEIHMAIQECNMFMQDGAFCHFSKLVSDFLKKKNIKLLNWPGNSPNVN